MDKVADVLNKLKRIYEQERSRVVRLLALKVSGLQEKMMSSLMKWRQIL